MGFDPCVGQGWWEAGNKPQGLGGTLWPSLPRVRPGERMLFETHRRHLLGAATSRFIESDCFARMSTLIPSQKGNSQAGREHA